MSRRESWPGEAPDAMPDRVHVEDVGDEEAEVDDEDTGDEHPQPADGEDGEGEGETEDEDDEDEPSLRLAGASSAELEVPDDVDLLEGEPRGSRRGVGIVLSRSNLEVANGLLESALAELEQVGVERDRITVMAVPGAFELPLGAMALAKTRRYACIIALGCVIRGETSRFEYVAGEAASGLQLAALETGVPVAFGVLTVDTEEQATARMASGAAAARTALEMADLFHQLRSTAQAAK